MTATSFFDKTIESVHRGGGGVSKKIGSIYSSFPEHRKPIKKYVENGLRSLYNLTTGIIMMDNKIIFNINDVPLPGSEGQKRFQGCQLSPLIWTFAAVGQRY